MLPTEQRYMGTGCGKTETYRKTIRNPITHLMDHCCSIKCCWRKFEDILDAVRRYEAEANVKKGAMLSTDIPVNSRDPEVATAFKNRQEAETLKAAQKNRDDDYEMHFRFCSKAIMDGCGVDAVAEAVEGREGPQRGNVLTHMARLHNVMIHEDVKAQELAGMLDSDFRNRVPLNADWQHQVFENGGEIDELLKNQEIWLKADRAYKAIAQRLAALPAAQKQSSAPQQQNSAPQKQTSNQKGQSLAPKAPLSVPKGQTADPQRNSPAEPGPSGKGPSKRQHSTDSQDGSRRTSRKV